MSQKKNEVGNRYGLLTVLREYPSSPSSGAVWICRCDCGQKVAVLGIRLRHGIVRSCGCLRTMPIEERKRRGLTPYTKPKENRI